jgi:ectoine hydroxylase-related dioxygenase (phytanoyl-CoA dioxygenase family)
MAYGKNPLRRLERDGLAVFDKLFPLSLLRKLRAEVLRRHESGELRRRGLVRDIGGRYTAVLPFEGPFLSPALYANPLLLKLLPALLGEHYRLSSLEAVISLPGSSEQYQHIDGPVRFDRKGGRPLDLSALPPYALALATPLCDATEENGPTVLWAGSHRAALRPRLPSERAIRAEFKEKRMVGPFGRSYLYDYRTFHRGTPNMSREPRPLLMMVFTRSWYRDPNLAEVSHGLAISKKGLAKIAPRHRFLFALAPAARRTLSP